MERRPAVRVTDAAGNVDARHHISQAFIPSLRTNGVTAALVNGAFGYYCDIEGHHAAPSAIAGVGPAALAAGERMHLPAATCWRGGEQFV
jgi:hypothetical protein